jgi:hypothetical protein
MIEDIPTTPKDQKTSEETESKFVIAARRVMNGGNSGDITRRGTAVLAGVALLTGGYIAGQNFSNENNQTKRANSISIENKHYQDIIKEIDAKATAKIDPASIVGMFVINQGNTVYQISNEIAGIQPEYKSGDKATKEWIDFTVLESGNAQGPYNEGDNFVVSRAKIDGKETLIVQEGTLNSNHLQLPLPPAINTDGTIPAPITH